VRAHTQDRTPVPLTQQREVRPGSLPATLLNTVFLNLPSEDQAVRLSSWNLLCALSKAYNIEPVRQLRPAPGLFLPPHNIELFVDLSREVSIKAPHLSLDFLGAFLEHYQSYTTQQKEYGLLYIAPWILQIETQLRTASADFEQTAKEVKSLLRAFIRLTYEKPQLAWYTHIWPTVGKVTELSRMLLGELFHYAVDFGFGSQQTDTAARILLACTTIDMQGQIITRLREVYLG
jgi:neurofibromin 1